MNTPKGFIEIYDANIPYGDAALVLIAVSSISTVKPHNNKKNCTVLTLTNHNTCAVDKSYAEVVSMISHAVGFP